MPGWQGDPYAFLTTGDITMGRWGCNTDSHAMLLDYYAQTLKPSFVVDPGQLNKTWISDGRGNEYTRYSDVDWSRIPGYTQRSNVGLDLTLDNSWQTDSAKLDAALFAGNPAVLWVTTDKGGTHFVVATGKTLLASGQVTYTINDPIHGLTDLSQYYHKFNAFWTYRPNVNAQKKNSSFLEIIAHSPVQLLLTDPLGRKSGFDPRNNISWNDIPGASYGIQTFTDLDGNSLPEEKVLYVPTPLNGDYSLQVIGYANGPYAVDIAESSAAGFITQDSFSGTAQPSSVDSRVIPYSSSPVLLYLPVVRR